MANDRRRTTRRAVLGRLNYELDTAVTIPDGQMARAEEIEMVAKAKAMSGDETPTPELAGAFPEGWERDLFAEQLDRRRPMVEAGAAKKATTKQDVQLLVFRQHIATAANAHREIVAFRQRHQPAPVESLPATTPAGAPDFNGLAIDISERVVEKVMAHLSVRPTTPPTEVTRIRKPRQPAKKVLIAGVEIPERQQSVALGIVQIAKLLLGDTETANKIAVGKGPAWLPELYKAVVLDDRMKIEKDHPEWTPGLSDVRSGGSHIEMQRELAILLGKPVSLDDAVGISQVLRKYVVVDMDNGATEGEILQFLRHTFNVTEENEGWPRFLIKSAGLTLVAGVYTVQNHQKMH